MAIVTHVLGACPGCGTADSFGNVMLPHGKYLFRGCKRCRYSERVSLPGVKKKIAYLDQFVLSGAFRGGDKRLVDVMGRVTKLCSLQLLAAPYSSVHEDETHQWTGYGGMTNEQLMKFIKQTARGNEFMASFEVEAVQLIRGFRAFLAGEPSEYARQRDDVIHGNVDVWDDYFRIEVGRYMGDVGEIRDLKEKAVRMLVDTFDAWQASTTSFDEDVALEVNAAGSSYMQAYMQWVMRVGGGDLDALWNGSIVSTFVQRMLHCLPREMPPEGKLATCSSFFASQHFALLPSQWLSARMYATVKGMVRRGAYANRDAAVSRMSGFFYDVKHIATYAPYCDAFFMDQAMAEIVRRPGVDLEQRYGTRVFSFSNLDDLVAWLDSLEAEMTSEHKEGLMVAYPQSLA